MDNYIVSARKYRPMSFDTVVGQSSLTTTLKNAISSAHLAHAYLFCGPRGVGKTTCARIFAKTINCLNKSADGEACNECESCVAFNEQRSYNIIELDAASNNSVEDIRLLIEQTRVPPQVGKYKVFIIDEVHMLSPAAFNAFLKTLEEPPSYVIFILATTEKHKILPTILSRCQIYDFNRMSVSDIVTHLQSIAEREGLTAEPAALNVIAQKADGGMRDALSIFDQVASFCQGNITYQQTIANLNVLDYEYFFRIVDEALDVKVEQMLLTLNEILNKGFDAGHFITGLTQHFRDLLVSRDQQTLVLLEASDEVRQKYWQQAQRCSPKFIINAMKYCNECDLNYRESKNKKLLVELTLIEVAQLNQPDEEPGAGRRPVHRLKSLFKKLQVKSVSRGDSQNASAASASQPSAPVVNKPTPPALSAPSAPAHSRVQIQNISIVSAINSIKASEEQSSVVAENQQEHTVEKVEAAKPLDLLQFQIALKGFAQSLPIEDKMMQGRLLNIESVQENDTSFVLLADNNVVAEELEKVIPSVVSYMADNYSYAGVNISTRVRKVEERTRVYSPRELFVKMSQDNSALLYLRDKLELTLG